MLAFFFGENKMITKEQAEKEKYFLQVRIPVKTSNVILINGLSQQVYGLQNTTECKPIKWKANGKCKTWKTRPKEFKLPIKHGLYDYGYITHENAHLFIVD